jgi:hypothetical protein
MLLKNDILLSALVSFRTYSKHISHLGRRESFEETINRNMNMHLDKFPKLSADITKAYNYVHQFKVMPSMRALQFSGEAILKNNARQYNCSFLNINNVRCFGEVMFLLLSGVGVGFSVQKRHTFNLPSIKKPKESGFFTAQDSIMGWAQCVDVLFDAYFYGRVKPQFDFGSIRPKGSYLVTTGAKAPGPEPLKKMLELVEEKLKNGLGRKLRSIEIHDIICIISDAVLAGGVRRSALISLFDRNDEEMLKCKSGEWWNTAPWRARANNSAVLPRNEVTKEEFFHIFETCQKSGSGEPGFFWTNNTELGTNPCCLAGTTKIQTKKGPVAIKDLDHKSFIAYNYLGEEVEAIAWKTGIKKTITLSFSDNTEVTCTEDHKFMDLYTGEEIEAKHTLGRVLTVSLRHHTGVMVNCISLGNEEDVYDFSLKDETHWGLLENGVVVHNCEISLNSNQFCNLSTINQTGIKNEKDFLNRVYQATLIGTLQAAYTDFDYLRPSWQETTEKEALLGVSFTGIADNHSKVTPEMLNKAAKVVLEVNEKYAKKLGINLSARTTAIKPEGTSSCVLGSSSGVHSRHSEYYIRRIRMNKDDSLAVYLKNKIPNLVEDDLFSSTGVVVSIPQKSPDGALTREKETAIDLFNRTINYNRNWVQEGHRSGDNYHNVSVTISVKEKEWDELKELMWKNRKSYSGISLLPYDGGTYKQAPFEDCSKEVYEEMSNFVSDVDLKEVKEENDNTVRIETVACSGGVCEIV